MVKIFSLDQFIELCNRTFREEVRLTPEDFLGDLKEQDEKVEFINSISAFDKEELKRIYNVANQILTRRK